MKLRFEKANLSGNIAPFGYNKIKLKDSKGYTLSINQNEAAIVKEIFRLYTLENATLSSVVKQLNNLNLKPRTAKEWTTSSIRDILSNPTYIGKLAWNRRKQNKKTKNGHIVVTRPRNPDYFIYDGLHESIIDKNTWQLVQQKRKQHTPKATHNNTIQNPLVGLLFCKKCGKPMQRRPYNKSSKPPTLICSNPKCDNVSSKLYIIEDKILEALKIWFKDYKVNYTVKSNSNSDYNKIIEKSITITKKELEKGNNKLSKIYDFFENGVYDYDEFTKRSQTVKGNIQSLENQLKKYDFLFKKSAEIQNSKSMAVPQLNNIIDLYDKLETAEDKNIFLKSIISKITYLKTEKAIKRGTDPSNFELHIYPKIF